MIYHILLSTGNGLRFVATDGFSEYFGERAQKKLDDTEYTT